MKSAGGQHLAVSQGKYYVWVKGILVRCIAPAVCVIRGVSKYG
jgi:hypothetical protein